MLRCKGAPRSYRYLIEDFGGSDEGTTSSSTSPISFNPQIKWLPTSAYLARNPMSLSPLTWINATGARKQF